MEIYLVQTPGVAVEQYSHTVLDDLTSILLCERVLLAVDCVAKKRNGDVGTVTCGDGRRRIGRTEQVDVRQEAVAHESKNRLS